MKPVKFVDPSKPSIKARFGAWLVRVAMKRPTIRRALEFADRQDRLARYAIAERLPARPARPAPPVRVSPVQPAYRPTSASPARKTKRTRRKATPPTPQPQLTTPQLPRVVSSMPTFRPAPMALPSNDLPSIAKWVTEFLASKHGSAIETTSLNSMLAPGGISPQAIQAALWHSHAAGWVKRAGKGKVAATAKTVRAGGVPETKARKTRKTRRSA